MLCTIDLPAVWMNPAGPPASEDGVVTKTGIWRSPGASATGTATYVTIFAANGSTAHVQGTAGGPGLRG